METFLCRLYNWDAERASLCIDGEPDMDVLNRIIDWGNNDLAMCEVSANMYLRTIDKVREYKYRLLLRDWSMKWKAQDIVDQMSLFELETCVNVNVFYCMHAFGVSLDACVDMASTLRTQETDASSSIYAIVANALVLRGGSLTKPEVKQLMRDNGLDANISIVRLRPFPDNHLDNHPLKNIDPESMSSARVREFVPPHMNVVHAIRERKFMQNRICYGSGKYTFMTMTSLFVNELVKISERSKRLEPKRIKRMKRALA